jgi:tripeptidyl-peptidase-1
MVSDPVIAYLDWLNYVLNQTSIPQTFSTSYGEDERQCICSIKLTRLADLDAETVPKDYALSVCNLFAQLGVRGSSVLFSSGDGNASPT